MAILTWRDVVAPNLSGGLDGIRVAGDLFNKGMDQAQQGIESWDQGQTAAADEAILNRMLAAGTDPNQFAQQMAAGQIVGPDGGNASMEMLGMVDSRRDLLRTRADAQYSSDRTRDLNARLEQAAPAIAKANEQAFANDLKGASATLAGSGLLPEQIDAQWNRFVQLRAADARTEAARLKAANSSSGVAATKLQIDMAKEAYGADLMEAANLGEDAVRAVYAGIPRELRVGALDKVDGLAPGMTESWRVKGLLEQATANSAKGKTGVAATTTSGGSWNSDPNSEHYVYNRNEPSRAVLGHGEFATPDVPIDTMTGPQAVKWANEVLLPATRKASPELRAKYGLTGDQGSSAIGSYQFLGAELDRLGKAQYGDQWANTVITQDVQDILAERLFHERKGGDLNKTWPSLEKISPAFKTPGYAQNFTWPQMQAILMREETGEFPPGFAKEAKNLRETFKNAPLSNEAKVLQAAAPNAGMTVTQVVDSLMKESPKAFGEDEDWGRAKANIEMLMKLDPSLTAAQAGGIMMSSFIEKNWYEPGEWWDSLGKGRFSDGQAETFVKNLQIAKNEAIDAENRTKKLARLDSLESAYKTAFHDAKLARNAIVNSKGNPSLVPHYAAKAEELYRIRQQLGSLVQAPGFNGPNQQPAPADTSTNALVASFKPEDQPVRSATPVLTPRTSVPVASNDGKPVKVADSQTIVFGANGEQQAAPPFEISEDALGKPNTVVQASKGAIPKGQGRTVIATFAPGTLDGDGFPYTGTDGGPSGVCRIDYVDAPEIDHGSKKPGQPYGPEAGRILEGLIANKQLTVKITKGRKTYGRDICQVEIEGGTSLDLELVKAGAAWVYDRYVKNDPRGAALRAAQADAQTNKRGLWELPGTPIYPDTWRRTQWKK